MKLSVIIGNRNDVVMYNVTLRAAIEACKAVDGGTEIIVVDNSNKELFELVRAVTPQTYIRQRKVKLIRQDFPCFTEARMEAARQAKGEYIFCVDSHVLFGHNILKDSVEFMDNIGPEIGFGHPPLNWGGQAEMHSRHDLKIDDHPWGGWNKRYAIPQKISWKFMPWICRRDWYLNTLKGYGCIADHRMSWGGAEFHQQIKTWLLGYENWAIATSPVIHLGPYPAKVAQMTPYKYRVYGNSGKYRPGLGVLVAFYVWGGDDLKDEARKVEDRLNNRHGITVDEFWPQAKEIGHEERQWFKTVQKMTYWEMMEQRPWDKP